MIRRLYFLDAGIVGYGKDLVVIEGVFGDFQLGSARREDRTRWWLKPTRERRGPCPSGKSEASGPRAER